MGLVIAFLSRISGIKNHKKEQKDIKGQSGRFKMGVRIPWRFRERFKNQGVFAKNSLIRFERKSKGPGINGHKKGGPASNWDRPGILVQLRVL
jgi:hypothetical protein